MSCSAEAPSLPKRYVLISSESALSDSDRMNLATALGQRYGKAIVIPVEGNPRAVIIKTTSESSALMRRECEQLAVGGMRLTTVLTSGSIGKLKNRASERDARYEQILERRILHSGPGGSHPGPKMARKHEDSKDEHSLQCD